MNVRLLRRIQKQILKEPRQFNILSWYSRDPGWDVPNCGTTACIAGWAACMAKKAKPSAGWARSWQPYRIAKKILGLDYSRANRLFYEDEWPEQFRGETTNPLKAARIAVKRIDHFIKTNGAE